MAVEDEGVHLLAEVRDVCAEREHVLDRSVVQVEADAHEALLAGADERLLALGGALEEQFALEDRGERGCGERQEGVGPRDRLRYACDDDGAGGREAADQRGAERPAAEQRQPASSKRSAGGGARAPARCAFPDRDERLDRAVFDLPERRLARDAE